VFVPKGSVTSIVDPNIVVHLCNPHIQETETGQSCVGGQTVLHNKLQAILSYGIAKPCLKEKK
jgi:hypothetical protein